MDSLQGKLLIAAPRLADPNFFHTVILMVQHSEEGAVGLVLNRPMSIPIQKVWAQVAPTTSCLIEGFVYQGGPCEGPLMVAHASGEASDLQVIPGVHFTTDRETIEDLVEAGKEPTRFFLGYAGWSPGQLEEEIETSSWLMLDAEPQHVFEPYDDLWQALHRQVGRASHANWIPPELMPDDPSMN